MIIEEACAIEKRLEKGKFPSNLISVYCNCLFYYRYLLPCHHIFHEHMYGAIKLLTANTWVKFQQMFEENVFEVYFNHQLVEVDMSEKIISEKAAENQRLAVNELMERTRDVYWKIEEKGDDKQTGIFLEELKSRLDHILNNVKIK
ncbi:hypothetical protein Glove_249g13 [Diversispora epigaea]|uniref:SWIM-type domain-containing protein n=1 Tax=Diversispora epigaea TaxID=1348612 RepID=A0A397I8F6_9GLOM|nr:hypothetical protein Glove_249g13 [Diversispora epigaea]